MNTVIVLAGGKGVRMKKKKHKALLLLNKKELVYYCLKTFQQHKKIDQIIIVSAKSDIEKTQKIVDKYKFGKVIAIVQGGKERQDSAFNGLKFVEKHTPSPSSRYSRDRQEGRRNESIVLFHNAANVFVSSKEIDELIFNAKKHGAAVVGRPVKDTIKQVDKNLLITKTIDRENLWAMQTPQAIEIKLALKAFSKAQKDKFVGTDDVSLVERIGGKVKIVECSEKNFKITTQKDLKRAELTNNN